MVGAAKVEVVGEMGKEAAENNAGWEVGEVENRPKAAAAAETEHSRRAEVATVAAEKEAAEMGMEGVERVAAETEMVEVGKAAAGTETVVAEKAAAAMVVVGSKRAAVAESKQEAEAKEAAGEGAPARTARIGRSCSPLDGTRRTCIARRISAPAGRAGSSSCR